MREKGKRFHSDQDLVQGLRAGNADALKQIYETYLPAFESYVLRSGGTHEDAGDCFQEGVTSVWVNIQQGKYQVRESATFKTYVLGVCKYKWMNKMRSAYQKNVSFPDILPEVSMVASDDQYEERLKVLNAGLSTLGHLCQDILRMFYFEKLNYEEMEERTGKTAESLKNQKYRCINRLREAVEQMTKKQS